MCLILPIHASGDGRVDCFQLAAVVNIRCCEHSRTSPCVDMFPFLLGRYIGAHQPGFDEHLKGWRGYERIEGGHRSPPAWCAEECDGARTILGQFGGVGLIGLITAKPLLIWDTEPGSLGLTSGDQRPWSFQQRVEESEGSILCSGAGAGTAQMLRTRNRKQGLKSGKKMCGEDPMQNDSQAQKTSQWD